MNDVISIDRGWIFQGCANVAALTDANLGAAFSGLVHDAGFTVYEPVASKKFVDAGGVTVSVIIGESSVDIHTWPETRTAHIRLFYCHYSENNDAKAERFFVLSKKYFKPEKVCEVERREFPV